MLSSKNSDKVYRGKNWSKEGIMSYINGNYTHVHSYHEGKKGYINKFEKSVKIPFLKVLHNHLPSVMPVDKEDLKLDESETAINDKIELSSAVVSASDATGSEAGSANPDNIT